MNDKKKPDYAAGARLARLLAAGNAMAPKSFLPIIGEEKANRVKVQVIESTDKLTVHIFPRDSEDVQRIWMLCQQILPARFPDSKGDCHPVRDPFVEPNVCIVMPAHRIPIWAPDYFRTEFVRVLEKLLEPN